MNDNNARQHFDCDTLVAATLGDTTVVGLVLVKPMKLTILTTSFPADIRRAGNEMIADPRFWEIRQLAGYEETPDVLRRMHDACRRAQVQNDTAPTGQNLVALKPDQNTMIGLQVGPNLVLILSVDSTHNIHMIGEVWDSTFLRGKVRELANVDDTPVALATMLRALRETKIQVASRRVNAYG